VQGDSANVSKLHRKKDVPRVIKPVINEEHVMERLNEEAEGLLRGSHPVPSLKSEVVGWIGPRPMDNTKNMICSRIEMCLSLGPYRI
jgi:hypothetical protein